MKDKLFFLSVSHSHSLSLLPLHLNQKFLIYSLPQGRDLVYFRAPRPARVHKLHSEFLKDEKERRIETVHKENRKGQRDLNWHELLKGSFYLTF